MRDVTFSVEFRHNSTRVKNMNQKDLIKSIKELKGIKPRTEWVTLVKSEIFNGAPEKRIITNLVRKASVFDIIKSSLIHRKLAYSFATLAFIAVGLVGFAQYTMPGDLLFPVRKMAEQSEAALSGQPGVQQNLVALNNRINDLALAAKEGKTSNIPSAINEININASELAKNLKDNPPQDSQTLTKIANNYKVLADMPGTDLTESQGIKDLNQAMAPYVQNEIEKLEKATLTEEQEVSLVEIKDLYEQGKYIEALEKILDSVNSTSQTDTDIINATSTIDTTSPLN